MRAMTTRLLGLTAFVGFALLRATAFAADPAPATPPASGDQHRGEFRQACGADLQTYCAASKTRDERHACIEANKDKFSDTCKAFMAAHPRGQGNGQGQASQSGQSTKP